MHLRIAFDRFKSHRLSFFENPKYENGRLSRGYDKFYATADAECGKKKPYHEECDVLVAHCGLSGGTHDIFATRRAFYLGNHSRAQEAVRCFYEYKRQFDQTVTNAFENVRQSLKMLVEGAAKHQTGNMELPSWL